MREIGSEYWIDETVFKKSNSFNALINFGDDNQLLLSGRSAIDYILNDIKDELNVVYMPSYCCDSMLQPFIDRGISIEFYNVLLDSQNGIHYNINFNKKIDIFFAMSYFGFDVSNMDQAINNFKDKGSIVIEDITHRLLSKTSHCSGSNYAVASLRKWFPIPSGGLAIKLKGSFSNNQLYRPDQNIIAKKINAMKLKFQYIIDDSNKNDQNKVEFLKLYAEFNQYLQKNYHLISIDELSKEILNKIDINSIIDKRKKNAKYLYDNIHESNKIKFMFEKLDYQNDCPLFVPLIVNVNVRDKLKDILVEYSVFCPVHWPKPFTIQINKDEVDIYSQELSLVCDQRYNLLDMKKIINILEEFEKIL